MSYNWAYGAAILVTLTLTALTLTQAAGPQLGLDERMLAVVFDHKEQMDKAPQVICF